MRTKETLYLTERVSAREAHQLKQCIRENAMRMSAGDNIFDIFASGSTRP